MHFPPAQAEKIWVIIEEGLEEFKKRAIAKAGNAQPQQSSSASSYEPATTTSNGSNEQVTESHSNDSEVIEENGGATNGLTLESVFEHALAQSDLAKSTKKMLKKLQKRSDIPLSVQSPKKKKFLKFLQDQFQLDADNANSIWDCLAASIQTMSSDVDGTATNNDRKRKASALSDAAGMQNKKAKTEVILADSTTDANGESTFDWQKHIQRIFNKTNANKQLPLELLKTKVIRKFVKSVGEDESNCAQYEKKFKKNLKKIVSLTVANGVVHQTD